MYSRSKNKHCKATPLSLIFFMCCTEFNYIGAMCLRESAGYRLDETGGGLIRYLTLAEAAEEGGRDGANKKGGEIELKIFGGWGDRNY